MLVGQHNFFLSNSFLFWLRFGPCLKNTVLNYNYLFFQLLSHGGRSDTDNHLETKTQNSSVEAAML